MEAGADVTPCREGLRSGKVWLDGSRRWADPESYLLGKSTGAGHDGPDPVVRDQDDAGGRRSQGRTDLSPATFCKSR